MSGGLHGNDGGGVGSRRGEGGEWWIRLFFLLYAAEPGVLIKNFSSTAFLIN